MRVAACFSICADPSHDEPSWAALSRSARMVPTSSWTRSRACASPARARRASSWPSWPAIRGSQRTARGRHAGRPRVREASRDLLVGGAPPCGFGGEVAPGDGPRLVLGAADVGILVGVQVRSYPLRGLEEQFSLAVPARRALSGKPRPRLDAKARAVACPALLVRGGHVWARIRTAEG
jgi:hypothetical protein